MGRKCVLLRNYDSNGNLISKECGVCHKVKAVSEFGKHKNKKDGVDTKCKECKKQYSKEYRKENKDKIADKEKERVAEYRKQKTKQSLIEIKAYVEIDPQRYDYNPNKEIYGIIYLVHNVKSDKYYVGQTTKQ